MSIMKFPTTPNLDIVADIIHLSGRGKNTVALVHLLILSMEKQDGGMYPITISISNPFKTIYFLLKKKY